MIGRFIDLSQSAVRIPDIVVVDTNLVVERLLASWFGEMATTPLSTAARRAITFFRLLNAQGGTGIVPPAVFTEVVHVVIKFWYRQERLRLDAARRQAYGRPIRDWHNLYKADPTILQAFRPDLGLLQALLTANGLRLLAPTDLGSIASGRTFHDELIHLVGTYGLDSSDALILMEAQRFGVTDIVTLDADMRRAQADFTVYTWL